MSNNHDKITVEHLIERGFWLANTLEESGIEEYRANLNDYKVDYFYKTVLTGRNALFVTAPGGAFYGYDKVDTLGRLDFLIANNFPPDEKTKLVYL